MSRCRTTLDDIWKRVTNYGDFSKCWEWQGGTCRGYGIVSVGNRSYRVHRLVYRLVKGDPGDSYVCHYCDNPGCCNPDHLWLGTTDDNMKDMVSKGRSSRLYGSMNGSSKLRDEQVLSVFDFRKCGMSHNKIASLLGVSRRLVGRILSGERRSNLTSIEGVNYGF